MKLEQISKEKKSIDYAIVKALKEAGKGVCAIAKELGVNKSTISYAYHKII